jgi:hypothetical protein
MQRMLRYVFSQHPTRKEAIMDKVVFFKSVFLSLLFSAFSLNMTLAADNISLETPSERGLALATLAKQRDSGWVDVQVQVVMTLSDDKGRQRVRELLVKSMEIAADGDKSLFIFNAPKDIKGSALLSFSHASEADEQWLYLPALKRVKRIASGNRSAPFMGSEFAYEDMSSFEVDKYHYHYIGEEACKGGLCHLLQQTPKYSDSGYYRRIVWQDQEHSRIWKIDFYDKNNQYLKTLHCSDFAQYLGKYWRPKKLIMVNHQSGKRTSLVYHGYQFNSGLRSADFHKSALSRTL